MKYLLSLTFYHIGDIISRTTMQWFNGLGYSIYSQLMIWSVDLDEKDKIWKPVKVAKNKRKSKKK
jgi:hypothetical protein